MNFAYQNTIDDCAADAMREPKLMSRSSSQPPIEHTYMFTHVDPN